MIAEASFKTTNARRIGWSFVSSHRPLSPFPRLYISVFNLSWHEWPYTLLETSQDSHAPTEIEQDINMMKFWNTTDTQHISTISLCLSTDRIEYSPTHLDHFFEHRWDQRKPQWHEAQFPGENKMVSPNWNKMAVHNDHTSTMSSSKRSQ